MQRTILGLNLGGTRTAIVEGTSEAKILRKYEFPAEADRPAWWDMVDHGR